MDYPVDFSRKKRKWLPLLLAVMALLAGLHFTSTYYREQINLLCGGGNQKFLAAAAVNNIDAMRELLRDGQANADCRDKQQWTAMHFAAHEGHAEQIAFLAGHRAPIDARTNYQWTPLHWAVYQQQLSAAITLLAHNADANAGNMTGNTPLHLCGFNNNVNMATILLDHRADINRRNRSGSTPLDYAVHQQAAEMVLFLLNRGADPNSGKGAGFAGKDSQPPLARATMLGSKEMVTMLLLFHADINMADATGNTALHEAARLNRREIVAILLRHQADPLRRNLAGDTPLELCRGQEARGLMLRRVTEIVFNLNKYTDQRNIIFAAPL